eukprot:scaffold3_cov273-Pinguiococcus_pyrenoidosus.AAC.21
MPNAAGSCETLQRTLELIGPPWRGCPFHGRISCPKDDALKEREACERRLNQSTHPKGHRNGTSLDGTKLQISIIAAADPPQSSTCCASRRHCCKSATFRAGSTTVGQSRPAAASLDALQLHSAVASRVVDRTTALRRGFGGRSGAAVEWQRNSASSLE